MNAYQIYSQLLFARAGAQGVPLSGTFELTPRCNFSCKMCYIHRAQNDAAALAQERSAADWLRLAEDCCRAGTLLLLLTGGEPLLRPDFREIYSGCKRLGLMLSINTNASLLDEKMAEFLANDPPLRVNITLYGASPETYGALCGNSSAWEKTTRAIELLQNAGILVKLNLSVTPYNRQDVPAIFNFANSHGLPLQAATYMFPPVRACEHGAFCADRLTPAQAAEEKLRCDRLRFSPDECRSRWQSLLRGEAVPDPDAECQELPTQKLACRAGSSTFWVTWEHELRPCGMMTQPGVRLDDLPFEAAWQKLRDETGRILVPAKCTACPARHACDQCAAVCQAESGSFTQPPDYLCRMTGAYLQKIRAACEASQTPGT